ncbi:MAG TPA: tRNA (adenosine(37)-N6)-threonylcarbamoyltransferase complex ATPase subunit type 1 TsaE [Candidatus Dependentiae bacterium]|nr:tRNA (adenosine(37)-N6)-threonylcarbamoyltransferase complex ATPase subunit type 1 TsaE [Candidatus Dependentiae bacterium]
MKLESQNEYIYSLDQIAEVAGCLQGLMSYCSVFTFTGPLGAGKTTIIRELLGRLGVHDPVTSPTFTYVNVYSNNEGQRFYHFDLYRINSLDAFCQAGFDEYLFQPNSWTFIEWPEPIMSLLTHDTCNIYIDYCDDKRKISIRRIE